ncbi:MAG TPA: hypothetical protein VGN12_14330, partial [Pirellulales bacterium]
GDVNLVTTSASGELQNHPEAQIKLPWVRRLQNFIPLTSQRTFRKLNQTHGGSAQTLFHIPVAFPRALFFIAFAFSDECKMMNRKQPSLKCTPFPNAVSFQKFRIPAYSSRIILHSAFSFRAERILPQSSPRPQRIS